MDRSNITTHDMPIQTTTSATDAAVEERERPFDVRFDSKARAGTRLRGCDSSIHPRYLHWTTSCTMMRLTPASPGTPFKPSRLWESEKHAFSDRSQPIRATLACVAAWTSNTKRGETKNIRCERATPFHQQPACSDTISRTVNGWQLKVVKPKK